MSVDIGDLSLWNKDEYFLNQWFSQLLERSQETLTESLCYFVRVRTQPPMSDIDQTLFPINLRSSNCYLLPWAVSRYTSGYQHHFEYCYSSSLCDTSHSFSFWLFLPRQYELNIQVGNRDVNVMNILLCSDENYLLANGKSVSIADRWFHIVLTKNDSQSDYQIWIDGQCLSKLIQYHISLPLSKQNVSLLNMLLFRKFGNNSLGSSSQTRIGDVNAFKRCLTPVEIRAIYQQQTLIKQVKVGAYINSNKIHNMKVDYIVEQAVQS